jgi:hypothetical protein
MKSLTTLFKILPHDVIVNHISPYTYEPKPPKHLLDIRTFVSDYNMIEAYYMTMMNEHILLHDLVEYCKYNVELSKFIDIYTKYLYKNGNKETKIRIILGKMTPNERIQFINDYIIIDDEF